MTEEPDVEGAIKDVRRVLASIPLTPQANRRQAFNVSSDLMFTQPRRVNWDRLIESARQGNTFAHMIVDFFLVVVVTEKRREALPEPLRSYAVDLMVDRLPPLKRGRRPYEQASRNMWIRGAVWLAMQYGLPRTRNDTKKKSSLPTSACAVVQLELAALGTHFAEKTIEKMTDDLPADWFVD